MVRGMCAFRRIGSAAGILSRRRYTRRRRSRDINTIMKANAGGFLSTDREKSPQKLFFLCGVPVEKNHTRDVEWRGIAMGVVTTTIIPPRTKRPFLVRPVLPRLVDSLDRASLVRVCAAAGRGIVRALVLTSVANEHLLC